MEGNQRSELSGAGALVVIAPFPGQPRLVAVLSALAPRAQVRALADLDELGSLGTDGGTLLIDGDHMLTEDIGWVRRILAARPGWQLVCTGADAGSRTTRGLLALPNSRWLASPPTLDELSALLPHATEKVLPSPAASAAPTPPPAAPLAPPAASKSPAPRATSTVPEGFGRDQVALLADISQRLELAFAALRERGRLTEQELETPAVELRRLLRYTRTLSCLLSPPPRGDEEFDLAALIEEQLTALTLRARKGPRFQPRSAQEGRAVEFVVRADRAAIVLAFETLLQLARLCAGQGETVRVVYTPQNSTSITVAIEFPSGPLAGLTSEQLTDIHVLRERLPELSPNDIAAASAILVSQGGSLQLIGNGNGHIGLHAKLPLERRNAGAATLRPAAPATTTTRASGNDPFA